MKSYLYFLVSILVSSYAQSILASPVEKAISEAGFDPSKVEISLAADIRKNFTQIAQSSRADIWLKIIESQADKAGRVETLPLQIAKTNDILCGDRIESLNRAPEYYRLIDCSKDLNPTSTTIDTRVAQFSDSEAMELIKAFAIWANPPSRELFVKYILSDILVLALERNNASEVSVVEGNFVFDDALLDTYFGRELIASSELALGSKFYNYPRGVTFEDGKVTTSLEFSDLILTNFFSSGGILLERSSFSSKIGSHTFLMQLLFLNYSAEYGLPKKPVLFSKNLLDIVIVQFVRPFRWVAWGELFAFPDLSSPRNVEYWKDVLQLNSNNVEPFSRYLDSDKRPNAEVLTPSSAAFSIIDDRGKNNSGAPRVSFSGVLGAIKSATGGRYVGFSGIEVKAAYLKSAVPSFVSINNPLVEAPLNFTIDMKSEGLSTLSVELVVDKDAVITTYTQDFKVKPGINVFSSIKLSEFQKTVRGESTREFFDPRSGVVRHYRFFFKRSVNEPLSTFAIPISFVLAPY